MPEMFVFQRAFRAKTKGSCWLLKPRTCSSKRLARVCYLKLQKNSQKRPFRRFAGAVRRRENLLLFTIGAPLKFSPQVQLPYPRKVGRFKPFIAPTYATSPPSTLRFCQVLSLKVGALRYEYGTVGLLALSTQVSGFPDLTLWTKSLTGHSRPDLGTSCNTRLR